MKRQLLLLICAAACILALSAASYGMADDVLSIPTGATGCVTLADLNADGQAETIIGGSDGVLHAFTSGGTELSGWPKTLAGAINDAAAVGDIDDDGQPEVVAVGAGQVYAYEANGTLMSGWPSSTFDGFYYSAPALGDLDNDGDLEIVLGSGYMQVMAYEYDGTIVTGWPQNAMDPVYGTPALGDIDDDGYLEVVAGDTTGFLWVWNGDGTPMSTWPSPNDSLMLGAITSSPALADFDNDGDLEIVITTHRYGAQESSAMAVLDKFGQYLPNWPLYWYPGIQASPAIGDVDGNGVPDIVFLTDDGWLISATPDCGLTPGWPAPVPNIGASVPQDYTYRASSPIIADIDADGAVEVIVGGYNGNVHAFNNNGSAVTGWPKAVTGAVRSTAAVGDCDGDGSWNIVIPTDGGNLYRWEVGGNTAYNPADLFPWATFHANNKRTGLFVADTTTHATNVSVSSAWTHESESVALSATLKRTSYNAPLAGKALVFKIDGTAVGTSNTDASGVAVLNYIPATTGTFTVTAEFAGDGKFSTSTGTGTLTVVTADVLQLLSGATGAITLADLDGDGSEETIVGCADYTVHIFDADGTEMSGWPQTLVSPVYNAASVGDIDRDGAMEIVVASGGGQWGGDVYAFEVDGTLIWQQGTQEPCILEASSSPSLGDIDGDGYLEAVVGSSTMSVCAINHDGTICAGWPALAMDPVYGAPALGDVDGNGTLDVVAGDTTGFLWAWNGDGTPLATWPSPNNSLMLGAITSSPALADLNNNGDLEIVITTHRYGTQNPSAVAVLNKYGQYLPNWPYTMYQGIQSSPAIGDVDGNGVPDIVIVTDGGQVMSFTPARQRTSGWPAPPPNIGATIPQDYSHRASSPIIADIDGDNAVEVIVGSYNGNVRAYNNDGTAVTGWPKTVTGAVRSTAAVGNMDGDSSWDIVAATDSGRVYRWEVAGNTSAKPARLFPWPTFHGDNQRSGAFRVLGQDSFTRGDNGTWGTADFGGPWSHLNFLTGNPWSETWIYIDYYGQGSVEPGYGGMTAGVSLLNQKAMDMDVTSRMETADFGGTFALIARASSYNTFYAATFSVTDAQFRLEKFQSGVKTVLQSEAIMQGLSLQMVRIRVEGNTIRAKHWDVGTAEPAAWNLVATDTSPLPAGKAGMWMSDEMMLYMYDNFYAECLSR